MVEGRDRKEWDATTGVGRPLEAKGKSPETPDE
jgi:hypothetical protein